MKVDGDWVKPGSFHFLHFVTFTAGKLDLPSVKHARGRFVWESAN